MVLVAALIGALAAGNAEQQEMYLVSGLVAALCIAFFIGSALWQQEVVSESEDPS